MAVWVRDPEGFYVDCKGSGCEFHTAASGPHQVWAGGDVLTEREDCPVQHVTTWSWSMLLLYNWLDQWGKTPLDMGVPVENLDPRYWEAMTLLRTEYARMDKEMHSRAESRRSHGRRTATNNYPGMD